MTGATMAVVAFQICLWLLNQKFTLRPRLMISVEGICQQWGSISTVTTPTSPTIDIDSMKRQTNISIINGTQILGFMHIA